MREKEKVCVRVREKESVGVRAYKRRRKKAMHTHTHRGSEAHRFNPRQKASDKSNCYERGGGNGHDPWPVSLPPGEAALYAQQAWAACDMELSVPTSLCWDPRLEIEVHSDSGVHHITLKTISPSIEPRQNGQDGMGDGEPLHKHPWSGPGSAAAAAAAGAAALALTGPEVRLVVLGGGAACDRQAARCRVTRRNPARHGRGSIMMIIIEARPPRPLAPSPFSQGPKAPGGLLCGAAAYGEGSWPGVGGWCGGAAMIRRRGRP